MNVDSIPEAGRRVLVRHVGDLVEDCTEHVHPTTAEAAVLSARVVGLDIAGLDIVVTDISKPIQEQRGCIVEVNAGPSLAHHVAPLYGEAQPVGEAIVDLLFAEDAKSRIPVIVVLCHHKATELIQTIESQFATGWA